VPAPQTGTVLESDPTMTKRTFVAFLLLLLVLLAAALILLDFRALRGQTGVQSQVSTYSFGYEEGTSMRNDQHLTVYINAGDDIREALAEALRDALADNSFFSNISVATLPARPSDDSVLVVTVAPHNLLWTPVYGRADLTVSVAYASDGAVAWIDEEVVTLTNEDTATVPVTRVRGEFQVEDSAYGIFSRPGYLHYLSDEIAGGIDESLQAQLASAGAN
jgi:hypothetical protein